MRTRHLNAFTLVEVLVVIGIIALMVSILLPTISNARDQANRVACLSNVRQLGLSAFTYAQSNKGVLPIEAQRGGLFPNQYYLFLDTFRADMYTLMKFGTPGVKPATNNPNKVWQCPTYPVSSWKVTTAPPLFVDNVDIIRTSYMYLGAGSTAQTNSWQNDPTRRAHRLGEKGQGTALGMRVLFADEVSYTSALGAALSNVGVEGWRVNHPPRRGRITRVVSGAQEALIFGSNQVFLDGHAEWVTAFPKVLKPGRNVGNQTPIQILLQGPGGNAIATQLDTPSSNLCLQSWWW